MKKWIAAFLLCTLVFSLSACGESNVSIENGSISENTMAMNKDGSVELGMVEDFSKDYYSMEELEKFVDDNIETFTNEHGKNAVKKEYIEEKNKKAYITLSFPSIENYNKFNQTESYLMPLKDAKKAGILPATLYSTSDSSTIDPSTLSDDEDYYIALLNEKYQVKVDGSIKYHLNGTMMNDSTIVSDENKQTVLLFQ